MEKFVELTPNEYAGFVQRSEAWFAVVDVLKELSPEFLSKEGTGTVCAVRAIRDLARRGKSNEQGECKDL